MVVFLVWLQINMDLQVFKDLALEALGQDKMQEPEDSGDNPPTKDLLVVVVIKDSWHTLDLADTRINPTFLDLLP